MGDDEEEAEDGCVAAGELAAGLVADVPGDWALPHPVTKLTGRARAATQRSARTAITLLLRHQTQSIVERLPGGGSESNGLTEVTAGQACRDRFVALIGLVTGPDSAELEPGGALFTDGGFPGRWPSVARAVSGLLTVGGAAERGAARRTAPQALRASAWLCPCRCRGGYLRHPFPARRLPRRAPRPAERPAR